MTEAQLSQWLEEISTDEGDLVEVRLLSTSGDWYRLLRPRLAEAQVEGTPAIRIEFDEPEPLL